MEHQNPVLLALYPNARGLGYACIEMPKNLIGYGIVTISPVSNSKLLRRVENFMNYFRPNIILVRDGTSLPQKKSGRIKKLTAAIETLSGEKGLSVFHYSREQIKDTFEVFGASTKYEISQKIVKWFEDLQPLSPKLRKAWESEDYNMGIFDAMALAVTHQNFTE